MKDWGFFICPVCNKKVVRTKRNKPKAHCSRKCFYLRNGSVLERIEKNKKIVGSCWEYTGLKNEAGYGRISLGHKLYFVHRLYYSLVVAKIPEGKIICHKCDNPKCFNPEHLFVGTYSDNMQDCIRKGRIKKPKNKTKEKV